MPTYPNTPLPSMVSAPEIIDSSLRFSVDQGYEVRRARTSHPRRRWTLSYLGKTVDEMRIIRDFLQQQRLGVLDFAWAHPTAIDHVTIVPTTPVTAQNWRHGLFTGMWVGIRGSPNPGINEQYWSVIWVDDTQVRLNGTTAAGIAGGADAWVFVPHAVGIFQDDTMASPETLIGPEQIPYTGRRGGFYNFSVVLEELF